MNIKDLYPTDEELDKVKNSVSYLENGKPIFIGERPYIEPRAIAKYAVDNAVGKIVEGVEAEADKDINYRKWGQALLITDFWQALKELR